MTDMVNNANINTKTQSYWTTPIDSPIAQELGMEFTPREVAGTIALIPPLLMADKFVNNKIGGEENKSWLKKIADWGDKISETFDKDGKRTAKFTEFINNNRFIKYFTDKYSAIPRNSLVKPMINPELSTSNEMAKYLSSLKDNGEYSKLFGKGKDALSLQTQSFILNLDPEQKKHDTKKLIKAADEVIKKGVDTVKKDSLIGGSIKLSYLNNKLKAGEAMLSKSPLGSYFTKTALNLKHNLTFGGGIFGFAFVSLTFNEAFEEMSKAPEGEKFSTFMHVLVTDFAGMIAIQAGTGFMYNLVGNKYRGISDKARTEIENIIQTANNNEFISKEGIKVAKLQRDMLFKGAKIEDVRKMNGKSLKAAKEMAEKMDCKLDLKFWERPLKFFGRILGTGLDEIQKTKFTVLGKKMKPTLKGLTGGAGRFLLALFAILPAIQNPMTNLTHKIFGKPETFLKKEEKTMNRIKNDEKNIIEEENVEHLAQQQEPVLPINPENLNNTNLLKQWTTMPKPQQKTDTIAASNLKHNKYDTATYIPSIQVDNSYLQVQEQQLNKRVNEILKNSDSTVSRLSKSINT